MATHSSILAWKIPWTEKPGRLQSVHAVSRVGHDLATKTPHILSTEKRPDFQFSERKDQKIRRKIRT